MFQRRERVKDVESAGGAAIAKGVCEAILPQLDAAGGTAGGGWRGARVGLGGWRGAYRIWRRSLRILLSSEASMYTNMRTLFVGEGDEIKGECREIDEPE